MRKPVVSANINEVVYWDFPNVFISKPNVDDFSKNIIKANNSHLDLPNINSFKIGNLTNKLNKILKEV